MPGKFTIALQAILLPPFCGGVGSLPVACLSKIAGGMYLLYLDESGSEDSDHFVVGGLAVHENDAAAIAGRLTMFFGRCPMRLGAKNSVRSTCVTDAAPGDECRRKSDDV